MCSYSIVKVQILEIYGTRKNSPREDISFTLDKQECIHRCKKVIVTENLVEAIGSTQDSSTDSLLVGIAIIRWDRSWGREGVARWLWG